MNVFIKRLEVKQYLFTVNVNFKSNCQSYFKNAHRVLSIMILICPPELSQIHTSRLDGTDQIGACVMTHGMTLRGINLLDSYVIL